MSNRWRRAFNGPAHGLKKKTLMNETIGCVKLAKMYDQHAARVLCVAGVLRTNPRVKGQRQSYTVTGQLPTKEAYAQQRDRSYTSTFGELVENAFSDIEALRDELQDWYDNLPQAFLDGMKGEALQEAISQLEQTEAPEVPDAFKEMEVVHLPNLDATSRGDRAAECAAALRDAAQALTAWFEKPENKDNTEAQECIDSLETAADDWESTEFPGMY